MDILSVEGFIPVHIPGLDHALVGTLSSTKNLNVGLVIEPTNAKDKHILHNAIASGIVKNVVLSADHQIEMNINEALIVTALMDRAGVDELRIGDMSTIVAQHGSIESWYDGDKREYVFRRING